MNQRRLVHLAFLALPPLVIAAIGLAHPMALTAATADRWVHLHVLVLPLFPLLGVGPWLMVRHRVDRPIEYAVAALGYTFGVCYTALDVLAGIAAGTLQQRAGGAGGNFMFDRGNAIAEFGVYALLIAVIVASGVVIKEARSRAIPGAILAVGGAWFFKDHHIYWPEGVLALVALALGWVALDAARDSHQGSKA